jgi:phage tail-like protein
VTGARYNLFCVIGRRPVISRALISLVLLSIIAFSAQISRAQQPTPSPLSSDRPIKVKLVSAPFGRYRYRLGSGTQDRYFAGFAQIVLNPKDTNQSPSEHGPEKLPGRSKYEAITLERGITHDADFSKWAGLTWENQSPRDLVLDTFNEAGHKSGTRQLIGCIVAEYHALANLDGVPNNFSIEHLRLRCKSVKQFSPPLICRVP